MMGWKIIFENYLGALAIFIIWFFTALRSGWVFDKSGEFNKGLLIANCVILLILFIGATIRTSIELEKVRKEQLTIEEKQVLSPKVDIKLFPFPDKAVTPYKYPLKQYILGIQNLNSNSVPILDFRVEFIFRNTITDVKQIPLLDTGGNLSVWGVEVYEQKKDGSIFQFEEQPIESAITKNFSLTIQQLKINEKDVNTNIAIFNCERWPERAAFSAKIVVDLSKKPEILKKPDKIGKYEGMYFYEIKGKKFTEKISGSIPNVENGKNKGSKNEDYWLQKLSKIDPEEGTIVYSTSDKKWLERNNYFIDFIPHITKDDFEIHVYRDRNNIFKVLISNSFSKKIILKYEDLDKLKNTPDHPKHMIAITWGKGENKLYIDGVLVDAYPKNSKNYDN